MQKFESACVFSLHTIEDDSLWFKHFGQKRKPLIKFHNIKFFYLAAKKITYPVFLNTYFSERLYNNGKDIKLRKEIKKVWRNKDDHISKLFSFPMYDQTLEIVKLGKDRFVFIQMMFDDIDQLSFRFFKLLELRSF